MRIGIDLDDTLGETMQSLVRYHNFQKNKNLSKKDIKSWEVNKYFNLSKKETRQLFEQFYASHYFKNLLPIPFAKETLTKLKNIGHELIVVTSRPDYLRNDTTNWVLSNFPGIFSSVHITFNPHIEESSDLPTKGEICKKLQIEVMIDDHIDYLSDCSPHVNHTILINQPWNKSNKNFLRAKCWHEILSIINKIH
jgi:5'(3')-deoxyribonucleotidase